MLATSLPSRRRVHTTAMASRLVVPTGGCAAQRNTSTACRGDASQAPVDQLSPALLGVLRARATTAGAHHLLLRSRCRAEHAYDEQAGARRARVLALTRARARRPGTPGTLRDGPTQRAPVLDAETRRRRYLGRTRKHTSARPVCRLRTGVRGSAAMCTDQADATEQDDKVVVDGSAGGSQFRGARCVADQRWSCTVA